MVRHIIPSSLKEALHYLSEGTFQIISGGTDVMVMKRNTPGLPPKEGKDLLYVANLKETHFIREDKNGLHIGSGTTLHDIEHSELVPDVLRRTISQMASPNIRHSATLTGNIANASPAGDSIVTLNLLHAKLKIECEASSRYEMVENFVLGVRKITLQPNEMITEIIIPIDYFTFTEWYKVGSRKADSISKVSFAGAYTISKGIIADFRLAFGSVSSRVVRSHDLEKRVVGCRVDEVSKIVPLLLEDYSKIITPIDDQRSNREYRHEVAMNILKDFLLHLRSEEE